MSTVDEALAVATLYASARWPELVPMKRLGVNIADRWDHDVMGVAVYRSGHAASLLVWRPGIPLERIPAKMDKAAAEVGLTGKWFP